MSEVRKIKSGLVKFPFDQFIGEAGNIFFDPATGSLFLSDGVTPGGIPLGGGGGGGGDVYKFGTPLNDQLAVWRNGTTIEGDSKLTWNGTNFTITGNLVVSGTVDGRDLSADGSKLDSIEAGATDDQTGAEITSSLDTYLGGTAWRDPGITDLSGFTSDDLDEGITNLYYTDARVDTYLQSGGITSINFDNSSAFLQWNDVDGTMDLVYNGTGVTLQIGQEMHFYAKATEAIANGQVVQFAGAQGNHLLIKRADLSDPLFKPEYLVGVATQDFAPNQFGYVTEFGKVRDINTSAYAEGTILYASTTVPGGFQTTPPTPAQGHNIIVAAVTRSHATQGTLQVRVSHQPNSDEVPEGSINLYFTDGRVSTVIQNTSIAELLDVDNDLINNLAEDSILIYNAASNEFVGESFLSVLERLKAELEVQYDRLVDEAGVYTYVGEAEPGTIKSAALWRIKRIYELAGGDIEILWANGNAAFDKVWDDRATYTF